MARLNRSKPSATTHEGAKAYTVSPAATLRRSVMACLLWEDQFYEDGVAIADRISSLVPITPAAEVSSIAVEAREKMKLRHVPLLLACEMAKHTSHKDLVEDMVAAIVQRPDEMTELLAIYSRGRSGPKKLNKLSKGLQRGLARAFQKFDAYQVAKYDRKGEVSLRDALFLCHAKPRDDEQALLWKQLIDGKLTPPDTWEVALSGGADKKTTWERLLSERKLGALALLRNLRNMLSAGVSEALIRDALGKMRVDRVLPFRFITAAKYAPNLEPYLEEAMLRALASAGKLPGRTALLVDHSGSMPGTMVSARSEIDRFDAACALAILARELCEEVRVFAFSDWFAEVPPRRGFGLRDAIKSAGTFHGTYLGAAVAEVGKRGTYDRLIVITDEQSHDPVGVPAAKGYMVNVASYKNGVGYGAWTHIDGWSESVLDYVRTSEAAQVM